MHQRIPIKTINFTDTKFSEEYKKLQKNILKYEKLDNTANIRKNIKSLDNKYLIENTTKSMQRTIEKISELKKYNHRRNKSNIEKNIVYEDKPKLLRAIDNNNILEISRLLDNINYFNETDKCGMGALHYACTSDNKIDILCMLLLARGTLKLEYKYEVNDMSIICNRNIKDVYNRTPIIIAAQNKVEKAIRLLSSDFYVDKNVQNNEGQTALHIACSEKYKNINIIETLLSNIEIINITKKDKKGNTSLMLTLEYVDKEVWDVFFKKLDINVNTDFKKINKIFDYDFFKKIIDTNNNDFFEYLNKKLTEKIIKKLLAREDENKMKIIHYAINHLQVNPKIINLIKIFLDYDEIITHTTKKIIITNEKNNIFRALVRPVKKFFRIKENKSPIKKYKIITLKSNYWCDMLYRYTNMDPEILKLLNLNNNYTYKGILFN